MGKVLLIVDMQKGFINKNEYSNLINKINNLIKRNTYNYYIFTKFINKTDSFYVKKLNWKNLISEESQKICVTIPQNSIIFDKYGYGLTQKDIDKIKEILADDKKIDVCGIQTGACVYAISTQLFDNLIFPNILINYTATSNNADYAKSVLVQQFGYVDEKGQE